MSDPGPTRNQSAKAGHHPGWQGILDADEQILWQGQPDARPRIEFDTLRDSLPGLAMTAFALFWIYQAAQASIMFSLFGLIFVGVGLRHFLQPILWPAYLRSRSWYTLTDRRAIVATDVPFKGRRLNSYPITPDTLVEFVADDPPSILLGPEQGKRSERAGFHHIAHADQVMVLIRRIQQGRFVATAADEAEA